MSPWQQKNKKKTSLFAQVFIAWKKKVFIAWKEKVKRQPFFFLRKG
jgi:hypothetical protein